MGKRSVIRWTFWLAMLAGWGIFAAEEPVVVHLDVLPYTQPDHGYALVVGQVVNRDTKREHVVRLSLPDQYGILGVVSREVSVAPGTQQTVLLPVPASIMAYIGECRVTLDGRRRLEPLAVNLQTQGALGKAHHQEAYSAVLVSRQVSYDALERALKHPVEGQMQVKLQRSERELDTWPGRWLAYSAYDAVAVTATDWQRAHESVRDALWRYAECGGVLIVVGNFVPPAPVELVQEGGDARSPYRILEVGLGRCAVFPSPQVIHPIAGDVLRDHMQRSRAMVWPRHANAAASHDLAPVVDKIKLPLGLALSVLMVFALVAGPVNMALLRRKNRSVWLFWITPLLGVLTSGLIVLSMLLGEGVTARVRTEGFTLLDERVGRATSLGVDGLYCPLRPRQGLLYSYDTEVTLGQVGEDFIGQNRQRDVVWDEGQHLQGDWVPARVPTYFRLRASESRSERLGLVRDGSGLAVVNGLGARIEHLMLMDFDGQVYETTDVAAGVQTAPLAATKFRPPPPRSLAQVALWDECWNFNRYSTLPNSGLLRPGSYIARIEGTPFLASGLRGSAQREERSVVFGRMRQEEVR
ncbi:MAG: hypothetical protein RBU25_20335 [Lentisphaeria bacterium]|jgi:hypothetical protein|nr:hypothetical protein [Lentisphaeria bacterium]